MVGADRQADVNTAASRPAAACVGIGGKSASDVKYCSTEEIVTLCDADEQQARESRELQAQGVHVEKV